MSKVIELARKAAAQNGDTLKDVPEKETVEFIQAFYTLARADLEAEVEQLRVQLAGCGVAAMQNTVYSRSQRVVRGDYGYSESYADVCRAVDSEIELRAENAKLRQALQDMVGTFCWGDMNAGEYGAIEAARAALEEK